MTVRRMADRIDERAVDSAYVLGILHGGIFGGLAALIGALMAYGVWKWPW